MGRIILVATCIAFVLWVTALYYASITPEVQASSGDDILYRRSVEAQADAAKALQDIAASLRNKCIPDK